jgi:uncharacterized lipoprotein YajG
MKRIISVLICSLALSGCATLKKELVVRTKPIEKPKLDVPMPQPVKMQSMQWVVITDKNYNDVIETVKDPNGLVFLVALDETSYKNLALNNANLLRFIREQKSVIAAYKQYYEKPKEDAQPDEQK